MGKLPPIVEQQLHALLGQMADVVGSEYRVCFIAKNNRRSNADILLGDHPLNKVILERLGAMIEVDDND